MLVTFQCCRSFIGLVGCNYFGLFKEAQEREERAAGYEGMCNYELKP